MCDVMLRAQCVQGFADELCCFELGVLSSRLTTVVLLRAGALQQVDHCERARLLICCCKGTVIRYVCSPNSTAISNTPLLQGTVNRKCTAWTPQPPFCSLNPSAPCQHTLPPAGTTVTDRNLPEPHPHQQKAHPHTSSNNLKCNQTTLLLSPRVHCTAQQLAAHNSCAPSSCKSVPTREFLKCCASQHTVLSWTQLSSVPVHP